MLYQTPIPSQSQSEKPAFEFGSTWDILGPFQIGTREAPWGADPLERLGGFHNLPHDPKAAFRSSLATNGTVSWISTEIKELHTTATSATASLNVSFDTVDWAFLRSVYGWAASQYQAWARSYLHVNVDENEDEGENEDQLQHVALYTEGILEFWIDDTHYFGGDMYAFRKAPLVLHLAPGRHTIELRLVRDARAMGAVGEPTVDVMIEAKKLAQDLEVLGDGRGEEGDERRGREAVLMADIVDGKLASPWASVALTNAGVDDVEIVGVEVCFYGGSEEPTSSPSVEVETQDVSGADSDPQPRKPADIMHTASARIVGSDGKGVVIVAGQTRPLAFDIAFPPPSLSTFPHISSLSSYSSLHLTISYTKLSHPDPGSNPTSDPKPSSNIHKLNLTHPLTHTSLSSPHKITFLHPGGLVSYAILRAPLRNATCGNTEKPPVLLAMHGAGLEASDPLVAHALDEVDDLCAWVLFPTGVTAWSGDDWHTWGFADVEAAVEYIPKWIKNVGWEGHDVDVERWLVMGHSNGGQGTWYTITHRPDKIIAAAPLSAYSSIQRYVPYELRQPADPRRTAIVSASLNSYRHEILLENAKGIPVLMQHGDIDDNVPAFHSRLMNQQLYLAGNDPSDSSYVEVPKHDHWWDGVMTTSPLKEFYRKWTGQEAKNVSIPRKLDEFSIVVGDPGDMGSKGGVRVLSLEDPGQYGRVDVKGNIIKTSNVADLKVDGAVMAVERVVIDGHEVDVSGRKVELAKSGGVWQIEEDREDVDGTRHRRGRQLGTMSAILRTHGPFTILPQGKDTVHIALQISRHLYQYFHAGSSIIPNTSSSSTLGGTGNVITVCIGHVPPVPHHPDFPIQATPSGISVRDSQGVKHDYSLGGSSRLGAAFLRPLDGERLELVVWGSDAAGLAQAARLVPTVTGVGQPDFIVLGESARWRGIEGALAMGFFGREWGVTGSSVVS